MSTYAQAILAAGNGQCSDGDIDPGLIRRVNQLYHDLTQDVFDAEHHYRHRVESGFWREVARMLSSAARPLAEGRTVVDLACGTGFVTQILADALDPNDRLIAMDISTAALASTARKCKATQLGLAVGDGAALPLANESVDLFAINAALHHMPRPAAVLAEIRRVLKPDGLFALGFEPNIKHFSSSIATLARGFDRAVWYASPRQNVRRLRARLGLTGGRFWSDENHDRIRHVINERLMQEGRVAKQLSTESILDIVDPHARGADDHAGFDAAGLIREFFPGYAVVQLKTSDYLGESPRRCRPFRCLVDAGFGAALPGHGSLFSTILRKPVGAKGWEA